MRIPSFGISRIGFGESEFTLHDNDRIDNEEGMKRSEIGCSLRSQTVERTAVVGRRWDYFSALYPMGSFLKRPP